MTGGSRFYKNVKKSYVVDKEFMGKEFFSEEERFFSKFK
jgi:hypothetical protein